MKTRVARSSLVFLFGAIAVAPFWTEPGAVASGVRVERLSERSFDETVQQLEWGFGGYGIALVSQMDYRQLTEDPEKHPRRSRSMSFLKRSWVGTVLDHAPEAALDLPLRLHVYERDDGGIVVGYYPPSALFGAYDEDALKELGETIEAAVTNIVRVATTSR